MTQDKQGETQMRFKSIAYGQIVPHERNKRDRISTIDTNEVETPTASNRRLKYAPC